MRLLTDSSSASHRPSAFTLIELMVNLLVLTVVMGALTSAVFVAGKALPDPQSPHQATGKAYEVVDQIAAELYGAVSFVDHQAKTVEFTVADRDNNGTPETILYEWSGTPGDSLERTYNGGDKTPVAANVYEFNLDYAIESTTDQPPPQPTETSEMLLLSNETAVDLKDYPITASKWTGQYFAPTFPSEATSWSVTQIWIKARLNLLPLGSTSVQLRTPTAGAVPSATILEQKTMNELDLLFSWGWRTFSFNSVANLAPGSGLCLVLAMQINDVASADILYDNGAGSGRLETSNAGGSWSNNNGKSLIYRVYGRYTHLTGAPQTITNTITRVGITLRTGSEPSARVQTEVQILNRPEVSLLEPL